MTNKQTNSWVEEFEKEYPNLNVEEENMGTITSYSAKNHVRNFISKTISQEKEKWVVEKVKELQELVPDWLNKQDIINLLQNK